MVQTQVRIWASIIEHPTPPFFRSWCDLTMRPRVVGVRFSGRGVLDHNILKKITIFVIFLTLYVYGPLKY